MVPRNSRLSSHKYASRPTFVWAVCLYLVYYIPCLHVINAGTTVFRSKDGV